MFTFRFVSSDRFFPFGLDAFGAEACAEASMSIDIVASFWREKIGLRIKL